MPPITDGTQAILEPHGDAEAAALADEVGDVDRLLDEIFAPLHEKADETVNTPSTHARRHVLRALIAESQAEAEARDCAATIAPAQPAERPLPDPIDDGGEVATPAPDLTPPAPGSTQAVPAEKITSSRPAPGAIIGDCKIIEYLDEGGYGVVYKAQHTRLDIETAVKLLNPRASVDPAAAERFMREAQAMARIRHANVLRTYDVGEHNNGYYLVTDFIDGQTLEKHIADRSRIDVDDCLSLMRQLASGLGAAHEQEVIHRDIKPGNIMITQDGNAILMDFGLAKDVSVDSTDDEARLTMDGYLLGTPFYVPPEQVGTASKNKVGPASDVYSLGATFYELLTGKVPFDGENVIDVVRKHLDVVPQPPSTHNKALSAGVDRLILKMLAKDAKKRPKDGNAVVTELDKLLSTSEAGSATGGNIPTTDRPPWLIPAAAAAIILLAAILLMRDTTPERPAESLNGLGHAGSEGDTLTPSQAQDAPPPTAAQLSMPTTAPAAAATTVTPGAAGTDPWFAKPRTYAVMPFATDEGQSQFFGNRIVMALKGEKATVVERNRIDEIIAELKLSKSAFADKATALRVGKLAGAHIMVIGEVSSYQGKTDVIGWAYDVETSEVLGVADPTPETVPAAVNKLLEEVAAALVYRSRVKTVGPAASKAPFVLQHGRLHGATAGMRLQVLNAQGAPIAVLRIADVTRDSATAVAEFGGEAIKENARVEERKED